MTWPLPPYWYSHCGEVRVVRRGSAGQPGTWDVWPGQGRGAGGVGAEERRLLAEDVQARDPRVRACVVGSWPRPTRAAWCRAAGLVLTAVT